MICRALTEDEKGQVPKLPEPRDRVTVLGVIDDNGEVVGAMGIFVAVHIDPLWVREDKRNHPRLLLKLWNYAKTHLAQMGAHGIIALMFEHDPGKPYEDVVERICKYAGGHEVAGRMFLVPLP